MGPQKPDAAAVASLRAVSYRIANTPAEALPPLAPQIAAALWQCRDLLSLPTESRSHGDIAVLVHRFNTQVSSLLQERTVPGRWAAVVITKAVVEAGGLNVLSKCNSWVRSLLGILKKPDPPSTRRLAAILLTRIFMLTWDYSNLVREITTPALQAFIPTCLSNVEAGRCSQSELQTVLDSFVALIARHTTIFRTHESAVRTLLARILSASPSNPETGVHYTDSHRSTSLRLLTLLHSCAPKQGASDKWAEVLHLLLKETHAVCDRAFRSVHEDWKSSSGIEASLTSKRLLQGDVGVESVDELGLRPWQGINAGSERLITLLNLLQTHMEVPTTSLVSVRVGAIVDLLARITSLTIPLPEKSEHNKANHEISKEEREALFMALPSIHTAALETIHTLISRFSHASLSMQRTFLDMILWVFSAEQTYLSVRYMAYRVLGQIVGLIGSAMGKQDVADLATVVRSACTDILPVPERNESSLDIISGALGSGKHGSSSSELESSNFRALSRSGQQIQDAATCFIRSCIGNLPAVCVPAKLRAQMDRAAVMLKDKDLLLASVLNPPVKPNNARFQPSLLPILARLYPDDGDVEALIRPRLPPVFTASEVVKANGSDWDVAEAADSVDEQEPTSDLLSALTDAIAPVDGDRSTLSAGEPLSSLVLDTSPAKRSAIETLDREDALKRPRPSASTDSVLPYDLQTLPGIGTGTAQGSAPSIMPVEGPEPRDPGPVDDVAVTIPMTSHDTFAETSHERDADLGSKGDDSDFEMPPLTMEADTDPEDEDEVS